MKGATRKNAQTGPKSNRLRMGGLPARYSFVLNPYVSERFTRCPSCNSPTRVGNPASRSCRAARGPEIGPSEQELPALCALRTLIVHQAELEQIIIASGFPPQPRTDYVVLGTIDGAPGAAVWLVTRSLCIFDSTWPISRNT